MKVQEGLLYSNEHEWIQKEGSKAKIGITDYAQNSLGDIAYVEMPEEDEEFALGDAFGVVESVKAASDLYMPVSGVVTAINEDVESDPAMINGKPYVSWIIEIELADEDELSTLMNAETYKEYTDK